MTAAAVQSPNTPPALPGVLGVTSAVPQGRKKDVTAALRARRHRARKKANQINASVTVSSDGQRSPPVPGKRGSKSATLQAPNASVRSPVPASLLPKAPIHKTTFIAALMLAVVSGGYSIFGMASIFTGATIPVIGMGVALEIAKLSAVAWFGEGRGSRTLRGALLALVGVLMCLNAIGAYGFLARAHIAQEMSGDLATMGRGAEIGAKIDAKDVEIADLDTRIGQIDAAVAAATKRGRTSSAMDLTSAQRRNRDALTAQRAEARRALVALQVEAASVDGQRKLVVADLGPALYLATLLGVDPAAMTRAFILLVAVLLDPAAVLLLMAATARAQ